MNTIFRATAALALLGATLPALAASATATRAWQFKPESNAGLAVRNLIGNIRVERGTLPASTSRRTRRSRRRRRPRRSALRASLSSAARTSARARASTCGFRTSTSQDLLGEGCIRLVLDELHRLPRGAHPPGWRQGRGARRARGPRNPRTGRDEARREQHRRRFPSRRISPGSSGSTAAAGC
jgi:hypothetical protein